MSIFCGPSPSTAPFSYPFSSEPKLSLPRLSAWNHFAAWNIYSSAPVFCTPRGTPRFHAIVKHCENTRYYGAVGHVDSRLHLRLRAVGKARCRRTIPRRPQHHGRGTAAELRCAEEEGRSPALFPLLRDY